MHFLDVSLTVSPQRFFNISWQFISPLRKLNESCHESKLFLVKSARFGSTPMKQDGRD